MSDTPDPYVEPWIEHGNPTLRIEREKLVSRHREPDRLSFACRAPEGTLYKAGTIFSADYPHMPIVERERTHDGPGYIYRLALEGIADPERTWIETEFAESVPEDGWDEIRRGIYTREPDDALWAKGTRYCDEVTGLVVAGYEYLYVVSREIRKAAAAGYYEVSLGLKGLRGTKPYKRTINGQVVSSSSKFDGYTLLTDNIYEDFPPTDSGLDASLSGTDIKVTYDASTLSLTDSYISTSEPPTEYIGQFWTPPDPPDVTIMTMAGEDIEYFYPFGWKCTSMTCEKIPGQTLWLVSVNYAYQIPSIATNATA